MTLVKTIALHLPQFHPIPENNRWWGKGFTEWTNVVKTRPRFRGHYQPHLPADLGFYDLRLPETRQAQAELARKFGVYGFCFYHYWFNGKRVLERPVNDMLASGKPDFPFCICWANENWTRRWDGKDAEVLLRQDYAADDDMAHIRSLIPMFKDKRYIHIDGRPLFVVYRASHLPNPTATVRLWRIEAERAGLPGLYLVRVESGENDLTDPRELGFDAAINFQPRWFSSAPRRFWRHKWWHRRRLLTHEPAFMDNAVFEYDDVVQYVLSQKDPGFPRIRCVCPSWDNSPRRKRDALILKNSNPQKFEYWLRETAKRAAAANDPAIDGAPVVFINAWNEWAEGTHLEPCQKWGTGYLEAVQRVVEAEKISLVYADKT